MPHISQTIRYQSQFIATTRPYATITVTFPLTTSGPIFPFFQCISVNYRAELVGQLSLIVDSIYVTTFLNYASFRIDEPIRSSAFLGVDNFNFLPLVSDNLKSTSVVDTRGQPKQVSQWQ